MVVKIYISATSVKFIWIEGVMKLYVIRICKIKCKKLIFVHIWFERRLIKAAVRIYQ